MPDCNFANVFFDLSLTIGPVGEEGGQDFLVYISTKDNLESFKKTKSSWLQNKVLYFDEYSWDNVFGELSKIIEDSDKGDWESSLPFLREAFEWEYEDYQFIDESLH